MGQTSKIGGSLTVKPKGWRLIKLRNQRNLKQREVEDAVGIKNLRLSLYERNESVSIDHLNLLAEFYGVDAKDLVDSESLADNEELTHKLMALHKYPIPTSEAATE